MKNQILYLMEFLSKSDNKFIEEFFLTIVRELGELELHTPTKYSQVQIKAIMQRFNIAVPLSCEEALITLDKNLDEYLPGDISKMKKQIFLTLMENNFPKKKVFLKTSLDFFISQLEPVERHIYDNLLLYILGLNRALGIFYTFYDDKNNTPEHFINYANALHVKLLKMIFNSEEQVLLDNALKELLGVYMSLYGKYLYM